jgi:hypothetical protein
MVYANMPAMVPAVHKEETRMIIRAMGLGFLLWLAVAAALRFAAAKYLFLEPDEAFQVQAFLAAPIVGAAATFALLKVLKEARGDEGEAAIGLALPGMLLNAFICHKFSTVFPMFDPGNPAFVSAFGTWSLLFAGSILFMGLSMTKLAPEDERV